MLLFFCAEDDTDTDVHCTLKQPIENHSACMFQLRKFFMILNLAIGGHSGGLSLTGIFVCKSQ